MRMFIGGNKTDKARESYNQMPVAFASRGPVVMTGPFAMMLQLWRSPMPSKSPAQARLMNAVAHNPAFAAKVGIPQSVGREFHEADKMKIAHAAAKPHLKRMRPLTTSRRFGSLA